MRSSIQPLCLYLLLFLFPIYIDASLLNRLSTSAVFVGGDICVPIPIENNTLYSNPDWSNPNFVYNIPDEEYPTTLEFRLYIQDYLNQHAYMFLRRGQCNGFETAQYDNYTFTTVYASLILPAFQGDSWNIFVHFLGGNYSLVVCPGACYDICPNECGGQGICNVTSAMCQCLDGYAGDDCSICLKCGDVIPVPWYKTWRFYVVIAAIAFVLLALAGFAIYRLNTASHHKDRGVRRAEFAKKRLLHHDSRKQKYKASSSRQFRSASSNSNGSAAQYTNLVPSVREEGVPNTPLLAPPSDSFNY
eukprot:TRINITY_DN6781_c0_g1_i1.p1 TRINITY_DN6781_c0_g1~~TRINITY_DN6781_c0_g1_i1.p1  ORF type:complete len:303 (-),score=32.97 TRINITY_DN6781_c0_g1_i1:38-946(-)